jgi:hypothetical protein
LYFKGFFVENSIIAKMQKNST